MKLETVVFLSLLALASPVTAQQSEGYRLSEHVFSAGGGPRDSAEPYSTGYRISSSSIGQMVGGVASRAASHIHYPGYQTSWIPPAEVYGLRFDAPDAFRWDAAPLADHYHVYRDPLDVLGSGTCGSCEQSAVYGTNSTDITLPSTGSGFLYLICASNLIGEEGTRGADSEGEERPAADPCP